MNSNFIGDIYQNFEDKWYNLIDKLDERIPIGRKIDSIDKIFPSFLIFLILVILLLAISLFSITTFILVPNYEVNILVLSDNGLPISNAEVIVSGASENISYFTDNFGKLNFSSNEIGFDFVVRKDGYVTNSSTFLGEERLIIQLAKSNNQSNLSGFEFNKNIFVRVIDVSNKIINGAEIKVACDANIFYLRNQNSDGFNLEILQSCVSLKLTATAFGFDERIISVNKNDERLNIILEKTMRTGSVLFNVNSLDGPENDVEIVVQNEFGEKETFFTSQQGSVLAKLKEGKYFFNINLMGKSKKGNFDLFANDFLEQNIMFESSASEFENIKNSLKSISFLVVDNNNDLLSNAIITVFNDGNIFKNLRTISGKTTPTKVSVELEKTSFLAIIKLAGYETKLVNVELQGDNNFQKIILDPKGSSLTVNVFNDINIAEKAAGVELFLTGFKEQIDLKYTDSNGNITFNNLPSGTYLIKVFSSDKKSDNQKLITIGKNAVVSTQVNLVTGEGNLIFNFFDEKGVRVNSNGKLIIKNAGNTVEENFVTTGFRYVTSKFKVGSKVIVEVSDNNFYSFTSHEFEVSRQTHTKEIYLRKIDSLPNDNEIQIFLKNVFENNPKNQNFKTTTKLISGKKYYLQFEILLNNDFVFPVIFNTNLNNLINNDSGLIFSGYSINESIIDDNNNFSITINETKSKSIPVVLELSIDSNNIKNITINYNAFQVDLNSLNYSKDFILGETFCISDCPVFAFDNFLILNGIEIPIESTPNRIYNDEDYLIKTKINNFSQQDFGQLSYFSSIEKRYFDSISFENDTNFLRKNIIITPLSKIVLQNYLVTPKNKKTGIVKLAGEIQNVNGSSIGSYLGNKNEFNLTLTNRDSLLVALKPDQINAKNNYPFAHIEVRYASGKKAIANWKIKQVVLDGEILLYEGKTNENGIDLFSFDATSLDVGDELIITATDLNGSIPAEKKIIVGKESFLSLDLAPACIIVKVNNTKVDFLGTEVFGLNLNENSILKIENSCNENKRVSLETELQLSKINFDLLANSNQEITVTGAKLNDLLGIYPLKISIENDSYFINKTIDFFLTDPSNCFYLEQGMFDLLNNNTISSGVINNCYKGRKDNFHPKMNISTNSVSISYNKPGTPEFIDFNAYVIGSAIESLAQGSMFTQGLKVWSHGDGRAKANVTSAMEVSEPYFLEEFYKTSEKNHYLGETYPRPSPDLRNRNPNIPFHDINLQNADLLNEKINDDYKNQKNISFKPTGLGQNISGFPLVPNEGDWWRPQNGSLPDYYTLFNNALEILGVNVNDRENFDESNFKELPNYSDYYNLSTTNAPVLNWPYNSEKYVIDIWHGPAPSTTDIQCLMGVCNEKFGTGHFRQDYGENSMASYGFSNTSVYGGVNMASSDRWTLNAPRWTGYRDGGDSANIVINTERCSDIENCAILESSYLGGGKFFTKIKTVGVPGGIFRSAHTRSISIQQENARIVENFVERRGTWNEEVSLPTVEGAVVRLGNYYSDASPVPEWTNITQWPDGTKPGDGQVTNTGFWGVVDVTPNGLVPPEHMPGQNYIYGCVLGDTACEEQLDYTFEGLAGNIKWIVRSENDPLVEYDSTGTVMYYIPHDTIPKGVRMFLYQGQVYAEYVGIPEIDSNRIDFNISRNDLIGSEYATIKVEDWVSGTERKAQNFRVKLVSGESSCVLDSSISGSTGVNSVPRVMFNWDWAAISKNQCNQSNPFYIYCDATQFNISLMKKLVDIENIFITNQKQLLPQNTAFYSYLIKDNFSKEFLNDFKNYYTSNIAVSSDSFVNKFSSFISNNKLEFEVAGGEMPYGGLYKVEINISDVDESTNSLFNNNSPISTIKVILTPIEKAKNYNPFFQTPLNGSLMGQNKNYGTGIDNLLSLNNKITLESSSSSFNQISVINSSSLSDLQQGKTLIFDSQLSRLYLVSSQPNPLTMTLSSDTGKIDGKYSIVGDNSSTMSASNWYLTGSSMGGRDCIDFESNTNKWFTPTKVNDEFTLNWNGTKKGTIILSTTVFSPKVQNNFLRVVSKNSQTVLKGSKVSTNNNQVFLDYLTSKGETDFDSLEGIFNKVRNNEMCISNNNEDVLVIWWNPEYLEQLSREIYSGQYRCN